MDVISLPDEMLALLMAMAIGCSPATPVVSGSTAGGTSVEETTVSSPSSDSGQNPNYTSDISTTNNGESTMISSITSGVQTDTSTPSGTTSTMSEATTYSMLNCDDYKGQATFEEVAYSPLGDNEAEMLAIELTNQIVAPSFLYSRILDDLAKIRSGHPEISSIEARSELSKSSLSIQFTELGAAQVHAGTYVDWSCPNELYDKIYVDMPAWSDVAIVYFDGLYNIPLLFPDYDILADVVSVSENVDVVDGDDICASFIGNDSIVYIFDNGYGDCPEGCQGHNYWGFSVDSLGSVEQLGAFAVPPAMMPMLPSWFADASECTKWL